MPAEFLEIPLLEMPPIAGSRGIPPDRFAGWLAAEERPGPRWITEFSRLPVILPPLPEMDCEALPRRTLVEPRSTGRSQRASLLSPRVKERETELLSPGLKGTQRTNRSRPTKRTFAGKKRAR
jgi:hypothetical protein